MPIINGLGYSQEWTPEKQRFLRRYLRLHLTIANGAMRKWKQNRYYYFDLNAGQGVNPETGEDGSPLIFVQEAERTPIEYCGYMIEQNDENFNVLQANLNRTSAWRAAAIHADHNEYMIDFCQQKYENSFGLFYADPSGVNDMPFNLLATISRFWKKADILIAISPTSVKRDRRAHNKVDLVERLERIKKSNWIVREPFSKHQWTFLYGTNGPVPTWKKEGFYSIDSPQGREYLDQINLTKNERNEIKQPPLFNLSGIS